LAREFAAADRREILTMPEQLGDHNAPSFRDSATILESELRPARKAFPILNRKSASSKPKSESIGYRYYQSHDTQ
jgi:hypothetical protein